MPWLLALNQKLAAMAGYALRKTTWARARLMAAFLRRIRVSTRARGEPLILGSDGIIRPGPGEPPRATAIL